MLSGSDIVTTRASSTIATVPARVRGVASSSHGVRNSHWYLLFLTPWLLLATPRTRAGTVAMVLLALVVTMSEPLSIVFVPLAAWRWWKAPCCRPVIYGY